MNSNSESLLTTAAYGNWQSPLRAQDIFKASENVSFLRPGTAGVFFLLNLTQENNHLALMYLGDDEILTRITSAQVNVRSSVHEYGGLPYAVSDNHVFFVNFNDQCVYRQAFDQQRRIIGESHRLTPSGPDRESTLRYADFQVDHHRNRLICVREDHRISNGQPVNALVAIDMDRGGEGEILFQDSDFVAAATLSPTGDMCAFMAWSHPNMPWDNTQIYIADFDSSNQFTNLRQLPHEQAASLVQPRFSPGGDLFFISDHRNYWNIYRIGAGQLVSPVELSQADAVLPIEAECCAPLWQLGQQNYDFVNPESLLVSMIKDGFWTLALANLRDQSLIPLRSQLGALEQVFYQRGKACFICATPQVGANIQTIDVTRQPAGKPRVLYQSRGVDMQGDEAISTAEHFSYKTDSDAIAYGIFYPPVNPRFQGEPNTLPPLLVNVHGGPTSSAKTVFNPTVQFWTSRGFSVLDVNHRGSTGYGRQFRHSLYQNWGVVDIADIIHAVEHLVSNNLVDSGKVAIRGGSAGGYAVLAALAASDIFTAGVSYYGIGDLEMLATDTHKFESRYLDQLIGPYPQAKALYQARSPIHHIERITAPVLLLQGEEDKVVPPNQAEFLYSRLKQQNSATRYLSFANEGHGFRQPGNQIAALEAELAFYKDNLL